MASKYPRFLRYCLPMCAFMVQVAFIVFCFFTSYDTSKMQQKFMVIYQGRQSLLRVGL